MCIRDRPNRFIAHIEIDGKREICHVKNTGRCRELLIPGAQVWVQKADSPSRKTKYDLIGVKKGEMLVNMDSQIPNRVVDEWMRGGGFGAGVNLSLIHISSSSDGNLSHWGGVGGIYV